MAITTSPRSQATTRRSGARTTGASATQTSPLDALRAALAAPLADFYLIVGSTVLLVAIGTMMVLSSSSVKAAVAYGDAYYFVKRQLVFLAVGVGLCWWLSRRSLTQLRWLGWIGFAGSVVLVLLTFPFGIDIGGNQAWLAVGPFSLQPSEFAKLGLIAWGADILHRKQKQLDRPAHLMFPFVPVAVLVVGLVILQKDLGTAMVIMMIFFGIMWVVGTPFRVLAAMCGVGAAGVAALVVTSPNRVQRILGFLDPTADHTGTNFQSNQSMYSLASGGWWGRGLGKSRAKWGSLTQSHSDFIFAVLGEELGLLGSLGVVGLFGLLGFAGFRIAMRSDSLFAKITSAGITLWFLCQAFVNIGVVLRLLPVLGVPLPFVSYGGTALLANLLALGFLLACARHEPAARRAIARSKGKLPRLSTVVAGGRG